MSFQKSTATPLGNLSYVSKQARGQDNPPGKPSLGVLLSKDLASIEDVTRVEGGIFIEKRSELLRKRLKRGAIESSHGDERLFDVGSK